MTTAWYHSESLRLLVESLTVTHTDDQYLSHEEKMQALKNLGLSDGVDIQIDGGSASQ